MKGIGAKSVDSIITDPPAGISFMGKAWDDDKGGRDQWIMWLSEVMRECNRVLKPGAHALVWSIPRTSHWTTTAIENAGFEIRDVVTHLFGSGFPKSLDVSKAIPEAKQWQGFGTALKPAAEFWILARKPLSEKTVAKNVLKWGCGALNIDGSRVGTETRHNPSASNTDREKWRMNTSEVDGRITTGRFPANLVLSCSEHCTDEMHDIECAIKMLDDQSGISKSSGGAGKASQKNLIRSGIKAGGEYSKPKNLGGLGDTGGASRFFYCAKVSSSERNAGLEGMPNKEVHRYGKGLGQGLDPNAPAIDKNHHPTVKPIKLMSYLINLITPPNGTVLDPFMGSGSTGIAAKKLGFKFIGIEREKEYFEIAEKRIGSR